MKHSKRAGIVFSVIRLNQYLRKGRYARTIGGGAPIYLAGLLEYLTREILEVAGDFAKSMNTNRISSKHIRLAIRDDPDLKKLFSEQNL